MLCRDRMQWTANPDAQLNVGHELPGSRSVCASSLAAKRWMSGARAAARRYIVIGSALAVGLLTVWSPAQAGPALSCIERFQAAGIDPAKLSPGARGRLDGYEFIVARDDNDAAKICARVDAEKTRTETLRAQLNNANLQLSKAQEQLYELKGGGPIKDNYLFVEGALLAWAVIASIWAGYFAGRLNPRRHNSF
jgi:hypothetical protein